MNKWNPLLWILSFAVGVLFTFLLIRFGHLDLYATLRQVRSVRPVSFSLLVLLTAAHIHLSSLKWLAVDARVRRADDASPSRGVSFALTSVGVALGQVLPVQLSMSLARTTGTYFYGKALRRGVGGTLFEQTFDVVVVGLLSIASAATFFLKGGGTCWTVTAITMMTAAMLLITPALRFLRTRLETLPLRGWSVAQRLHRALAAIRDARLLDARLGRHLLALSTARFVIQVLMANQAARALNMPIPGWQLAAAMPLVVIACVLVVTPAGLGVNEWSYATTLHMFGVPLQTGAQWALANRILVASSCFLVVAFAAAVLGLMRMISGLRLARTAHKPS